MIRLFVILFVFIVSCEGSIKDSSQVEKEETIKAFGTDDFEYKTYYMGFLKRGENRGQDSTAVMELQKAHLNYMSKLAAEGKLSIAGPFLDDWETRGIVIYAVDSLSEAQALAEADPAVQAGRLKVEIHPWMSARGSKLP